MIMQMIKKDTFPAQTKQTAIHVIQQGCTHLYELWLVYMYHSLLVAILFMPHPVSQNRILM